MRLTWGDSLEKLKELGDNSVDSVVTDPPYGLAFMGKKWDYDVPSVELWREVFRVLKPGGHLLSFGGTRTYHRMVVNIEDAGFEIRDQIMWIYGSGFPKSLDVSKAIDKAAGAEREVIGSKERPGGFDRGVLANTNFGHKHSPDSGNITAPATDLAKQWQGWGTALKPANEPIVLARKPLEKGLTVAENVEKWGCGAINVDGSRIEGAKPQTIQGGRSIKGGAFNSNDDAEARNVLSDNSQGRWPANVLFGCDCEVSEGKAPSGQHGDYCAVKMLDEQSGVLKTNSGKSLGSKAGAKSIYGNHLNHKTYDNLKGDSGGASRFFYVAKASKRERNAGLEGMPERERPLAISQWKNQTNGSGEVMGPSKPQVNHHPTVKPLKLMEYLIKLITPPNGTVLDPFMGSGTTGCAAVKLGFNFIGIEREQEYVEIAKRRIEHWKQEEEETCPDEKNQLTMNI